MTITRSEYDTLTRRKAAQALQATFPVREGWEGGALTVFVPGTPSNMKNKVGHWSKRARWAKEWRTRAAAAMYAQVPPAPPHLRGWPWPPWEPKRVTFTVYGKSRFDDDNVALVCSPARDALQDMAVIDNDGNVAHRFTYEQAKPTRAAGATHGIAIRIELATPPASGAR